MSVGGAAGSPKARTYLAIGGRSGGSSWVREVLTLQSETKPCDAPMQDYVHILGTSEVGPDSTELRVHISQGGVASGKIDDHDDKLLAIADRSSKTAHLTQLGHQRAEKSDAEWETIWREDTQ